jgi:hypothetical protein
MTELQTLRAKLGSIMDGMMAMKALAAEIRETNGGPAYLAEKLERDAAEAYDIAEEIDRPASPQPANNGCTSTEAADLIADLADAVQAHRLMIEGLVAHLAGNEPDKWTLEGLQAATNALANRTETARAAICGEEPRWRAQA